MLLGFIYYQDWMESNMESRGKGRVYWIGKTKVTFDCNKGWKFTFN